MYFIGGNSIENLWKKSMFIFYVVIFNFIFLIKFSSLMPSAVISWLFQCPLLERSFQIRHFTMDLCTNWPNKLYNKLVVSMSRYIAIYAIHIFHLLPELIFKISG
jgi:hypothetical protein